MFAVFAEPTAFRRFGNTLEDYYSASVEPSYLYLRNRFLQYSHARCLADELEMFGQKLPRVLPASVAWPTGFAEVLDFAYAGSPQARPRRFDQVAALGGDSPHHGFPLRNAPEEVFSVVTGRGSTSSAGVHLEQLSLQQAIREAFPGAIFLHRAKGWRVHDWQNTAFERTIRVNPTTSPIYPKPIVRTFVNVGLGESGIVEDHIRRSDQGFLAECHLQINERVEGYLEGGVRKAYADLRETKPWMSPKTRDFRTTGVVIHIQEGWFMKPGVRQQVADALRDLMQREYSIAPQDMGTAAGNIAFVKNNVRIHNARSVVLFDTTHGSLRLTEPAYCDFGRLLTRLERAIELKGADDQGLTSDLVSRLRSWFELLDAGSITRDSDDGGASIDGWIQVYSVGSVVARRDQKNVLRDIEIDGYEIMELDGQERMFYRYKTRRGKGLIPAKKVESVGSEWALVYWNPETRQIRTGLDENDE